MLNKWILKISISNHQPTYDTIKEHEISTLSQYLRRRSKQHYPICVVVVPSSAEHRQRLHLQHKMHGAISRRNGEATNRSSPNPANIPIT